LLEPGLGADPGGHRRGFVELVARARALPGLASAASGAGRLVISREEARGRREVSLTVAGARVTGEVGGAPFDVTVRRKEMEGHLAGEPLWIWMHGREAEGHIGGHDVSYVLHETPSGHLLRGSSVGHTVRFEQSAGTLSWLPGCEQPLVRLPRLSPDETVYQGSCASGRRMRVRVPGSLEELPALPRFILLSLLLNEREDGPGRQLFSKAGGR